jgi:hypothetical protein
MLASRRPAAPHGNAVPSARRLRNACVAIAALLIGLGVATTAHAQVQPDSVRRDSVPTPILLRVGGDEAQEAARRPIRRAPVLRPPLSPRRAFLMSALLPGLAQSRLEKATSGAFFAGIELAAVAMLRRSANDVREVRRQGTDTVVGNFVVAPGTGVLTPSGTLPPRFEASMERSRKLHVEDWAAAIVFNHLIAGADAFVAAQLWDVPTQMTMVPTANGLALVATLRW